MLDTQGIIDVDSDAPSENDNSLHDMPTLEYDTDDDVQTSTEIGTQPSQLFKQQAPPIQHILQRLQKVFQTLDNWSTSIT